MANLGALLEQLCVLLGFSLEERKAFKVGTKRTWKNGVYKKTKTKTGTKWVRVGSAQSSKTKTKKTKKTKKKTKTKLKGKSELAKTSGIPARSEEEVKEVKEWSETLFDSSWAKKSFKKGIKPYQKLGLSESQSIYAAAVTAGWADNTFSPGAGALRGIVAKVVGRDLKEETSLLKTQGKGERLGTIQHAENETVRAFDEQPPPDPVLVKATLEKIAKASQDAHPDPVTLYRGVSGSNGEDAKKTGKLAVATLSSWTTDPKIAAEFAGDKGVIMKAALPKSAIMMSHKVCPNLLRKEKEIVVASKGAIKCEIHTMSESAPKTPEGIFHTVKLNNLTMRVPNESMKGATPAFDDWMQTFREILRSKKSK